MIGKALINMDDIPVAKNPERRTPCVLLLDCSKSMEGNPIDELNRGLRVLKAALLEDDIARNSVEISVITFGGVVRLQHDFLSPEEFGPPVLTASGNTPMGEALETALDKVEERKSLLRAQGIPFYRPWIFLITDGVPTDDVDKVIPQIHLGSKNKKFSFFAVGVKNADMDELKRICPPERGPKQLQGLKFTELFEWLSDSLTRVANSRPGEQTALKESDSWSTC